MDHARFSPSAAYRFINCPGSTLLCESLPSLPDTIYGLEGSAAHLLAQRCLEIGIDATLKIGSPLEYKTWRDRVTLEMATAVQVYLDEIRRKRAFTSRHFIEKWVDLSWLVPDCSGTADHIAVELLDCLYVDDYKHGAGVAVEVKGNPQLMIYGLGALGEKNKYGVDEVEITVTQPRAPHPDGPVRKARYKVDELYEWGRNILRPAIQRALFADHPSYTVGDWCRWCDGKINCPAMRAEVRKSALTMFDDALVPVEPTAVLPDAKSLSADQLDRILTFSPIFSAWLADITAEGVSRLKNGAKNAPTQWKLVKGKGGRNWKDEVAIHNFIKNFPTVDAYTEPVIKSPAQMEAEFILAKLDSAMLNEFIEKKSGQPKLAPISDNRAALPSLVESMFGGEINPFE